jgi:lycopene cyclase domain-containing protein
MTYFTFLFRFLGPPLLILGFLTWWDARKGRRMPAALSSWPTWLVIVGHIVVAVLYTTPWDNYLVATRVWWYEPELVSGIIIGWVPIEEYIFFVLQTLMTSLWLIWLAKRLRMPSAPFDPTAPSARRARWGFTAFFGVLWFASLILLISRWRPGTYLALELTWALLPILLQVAFGGDILWRYRNLALAALIPAWLYLSAADFLAIGLGTWIIAPDQSVGINVGHLPIEEIIFFLVTNMLVVFGTILVLAQESQARAPAAVINFLHRFAPAPQPLSTTPTTAAAAPAQEKQ